MNYENPFNEFFQAINSLSETEAKQWLVNNLPRFDPKAQGEILIAFYEEARDKRDGISNIDDMTYDEFKQSCEEMQIAFENKRLEDRNK